MDEGESRAGVKAAIGWRRVLSVIERWLVLPLAGALVGAMIIGRLTDWIMGPKAYTVYFVGDEGRESCRQIWKGFSSGESRLSTLDGISLQLKRRDDRGDPVRARQISEELAREHDTLLVVGHVLSTQTQAALPAYVRAHPPIPCILTLETNPNLTSASAAGGYVSTFRLSPTDDRQAETAAQFALDRDARSFWVVEDATNPVYSEYLATTFIQQVHARKGKVLLRSTTREIPPAHILSALSIDWVFYAGEWPNAVILIGQVQKMSGNRKPPSMILSDGCATSELIENGSPGANGVFVTHPMPAGSYKEHFQLYGSNAHWLLAQLVEEADGRFGQLASRRNRLGYFIRHFLGIHRVGDARNAVSALMEESVLTGHEFEQKDSTCVFGNDGTCRSSSFRVWQVQGDHFVDAKYLTPLR